MRHKNTILLLACLSILFPGAFVFGFPGVMASHWQVSFGVSKAAIGQLMFFILMGAGSSMFLAGRLTERFPTNWIVFSGSLAASLLMFFVGYATRINQVYAWAFFTGVATSFVYVPSLSIFQRMFPEKRGLVAGVFNLTFGGSAALLSPLFSNLLVSKGYLFTTGFAAILSLFLGASASFFIKAPPKDRPDGKPTTADMSVGGILKMKAFWMLWFVWAFSGAAGIAMIVLSPLFGEALGYNLTQYVYILVAFNLTNGIGRLICGMLSDVYSRQMIMMLVFLIAAVAFFMMPFSQSLVFVCFMAGLVGLSFGVLFTVSAPLITEIFGVENFGKVFGLVFTAYGFMAGFLGPWLSGLILDATGSNFVFVFTYLGLFLLISSVLIIRVRPEIS